MFYFIDALAQRVLYHKQGDKQMTSEKSKAAYSRRKARKLVKAIHNDIDRKSHVHHIDGNPLNNSMNNLCVLPCVFHTSLHNLGAKRTVIVLKRLERMLKIYNNGFWDLEFDKHVPTSKLF